MFKCRHIKMSLSGSLYVEAAILNMQAYVL